MGLLTLNQSQRYFLMHVVAVCWLAVPSILSSITYFSGFFSRLHVFFICVAGLYLFRWSGSEKFNFLFHFDLEQRNDHELGGDVLSWWGLEGTFVPGF